MTALSALRCRTSLQSLLNCELHLWDFPPRSQTGFPDVFAFGLFSSNVCFHQKVDVLSSFVLETLFTHVTSSNSWSPTFGLLLLSTSWAQLMSRHASHVCRTNNNMPPPWFSSHVSISGRHHLECDTFTDPENVNQKCWKQLRFPSKYEPLNSLKCLHNTFPLSLPGLGLSNSLGNWQVCKIWIPFEVMNIYAYLKNLETSAGIYRWTSVHLPPCLIPWPFLETISLKRGKKNLVKLGLPYKSDVIQCGIVPMFTSDGVNCWVCGCLQTGKQEQELEAAESRQTANAWASASQPS